jgi:hypothetical protein
MTALTGTRPSQYAENYYDENGNVVEFDIGGFMVIPDVIVHRVTQQTYGNFLKYNSFIRFAANLTDVALAREDLKTNYGIDTIYFPITINLEASSVPLSIKQLLDVIPNSGANNDTFADGALLQFDSATNTFTGVSAGEGDGFAYISDITSAINALTDSAPEALNTLNELAASLGDDDDFAGTVTTSIAGLQTQIDNLPDVFSGDYDDLTNKPTIPDITGLASETYVTNAISNIDLSGYVTGTELEAEDYASKSYVSTAVGNIDLSAYATTTYVDNNVYSDSDVDTHLNNSSLTAGNILSWSGTDYAWIEPAPHTFIKQWASFRVPHGSTYAYNGGLAPGQWTIMPDNVNDSISDTSDDLIASMTFKISPNVANTQLQVNSVDFGFRSGATIVDETFTTSHTFDYTDFLNPNSQIFSVRGGEWDIEFTLLGSNTTNQAIKLLRVGD